MAEDQSASRYSDEKAKYGGLDSPTILKLLRDAGYDWSSVHHACYKNFCYLKFVELLAKKMAEVSAPRSERGTPINQCDGCQRGLPVVNGKHDLTGTAGSYPGEVMACTKDRYVDHKVIEAIRVGCNAAEVHLTCSYPACSCKQIPAAIRAALSERN